MRARAGILRWPFLPVAPPPSNIGLFRVCPRPFGGIWRRVGWSTTVGRQVAQLPVASSRGIRACAACVQSPACLSRLLSCFRRAFELLSDHDGAAAARHSRIAARSGALSRRFVPSSSAGLAIDAPPACAGTGRLVSPGRLGTTRHGRLREFSERDQSYKEGLVRVLPSNSDVVLAGAVHSLLSLARIRFCSLRLTLERIEGLLARWATMPDR